jgi:hypothetical protein
MQARWSTARQARKSDSGIGCNIEIDWDESRRIESAGEALPGERLDDSDDSDDVGVKVSELVSGNSELLVGAAACDLDWVALRSDGVDFELCYKSGVTRVCIGGVPVSSDPPCVLEGENGGRRLADLEDGAGTLGIPTQR